MTLYSLIDQTNENITNSGICCSNKPHKTRSDMSIIEGCKCTENC